MISPARVAAYETLRAVSAGGADLPSAFAVARAGLVDERDRALAAEIAAGVQRWRAALDHVIAAFARRPLAKLDPEIVDILRLSAYQLLHLTRVPASAVVHDAVNLVRRAGKTSAAGFVNAVLRQISRQRDGLPLPPRPQEAGDRAAALDYLSITLSHPRWLAARWLDRLGFEAAEACTTAVYGMTEAAEHPHMAARGTFVTVDGVSQPGPAPRFSRTPGAISGPPRAAGADTDAALAAWGVGDDDREALREAGAIV